MRPLILAALLASFSIVPPAAAGFSYLLEDHVILCGDGCTTYDRENYPFEWPTPEQKYPSVTDLRGFTYRGAVYLWPADAYALNEMSRLGYLDPPLDGVTPRKPGWVLPRPRPTP